MGSKRTPRKGIRIAPRSRFELRRNSSGLCGAAFTQDLTELEASARERFERIKFQPNEALPQTHRAVSMRSPLPVCNPQISSPPAIRFALPLRSRLRIVGVTFRWRTPGRFGRSAMCRSSTMNETGRWTPRVFGVCGPLERVRRAESR